MLINELELYSANESKRKLLKWGSSAKLQPSQFKHVKNMKLININDEAILDKLPKNKMFGVSDLEREITLKELKLTSKTVEVFLNSIFLQTGDYSLTESDSNGPKAKVSIGKNDFSDRFVSDEDGEYIYFFENDSKVYHYDLQELMSKIASNIDYAYSNCHEYETNATVDIYISPLNGRIFMGLWNGTMYDGSWMEFFELRMFSFVYYGKGGVTYKDKFKPMWDNIQQLVKHKFITRKGGTLSRAFGDKNYYTQLPLAFDSDNFEYDSADNLTKMLELMNVYSDALYKTHDFKVYQKLLKYRSIRGLTDYSGKIKSEKGGYNGPNVQ